MGPHRDRSIRRKLTLVILATSGIVLLLACGALVTYDVVTLRRAMAQNLTVLADVLGRNSTGSLSFEDEAAAREMLAALAAERHIVTAGLYEAGGGRFAEYLRSGAGAELPVSPPVDGNVFDGNRLYATVPVIFDGKRIGTMHVRSDLGQIWERLRSYALIVAVVAALAGLVTFALSFVLQRTISGPLLELAATARVVAERKDYSVRAAKVSSDEIGLLTDAFNQMLSQIESGQEALQQANRSLEGQAGQLQEANRSLQGQADQFARTASVLNASSADILQLSTRLAAGALETATAVSQTSTTVEEVKQTALLSSQRTRQVSESAQHVADISQRGKRSTEQTVLDMNRIRDQMRSIAQSMLRLSEQTQTIGNIIATVEDLSQQSNLLAVNAAIEAAKAGEHGRGFSVVAHEVKNLAEQSRQATTQVRTILSDVQKATNAAVMATEQGTKAVEAGVGRSEEAGESIMSLANSVGDAAQAAVQIAASSQQQLVGMDQVADAMASIKQASGQNAESARQLESAALNLSALGDRLKRLVDDKVASAPQAAGGIARVHPHRTANSATSRRVTSQPQVADARPAALNTLPRTGDRLQMEAVPVAGVDDPAGDGVDGRPRDGAADTVSPPRPPI